MSQLQEEARTVTAIYDGQVLRPETPLDLTVNGRYVLSITPVEAAAHQRDAWTVLNEHMGSVEAPSDWALEHDHYLYGTPKRQTKPADEQ